MLANASLDVSLHDGTVYMSIPLIIQSRTLKLPQSLSDQQLAAFTVGLIDGKGCLQVNHRRKKLLQFRLIVKLSDKHLNYSMLYQISLKFGGYIRRIKEKDNDFVQWVINDKTILINSIIPLFEKYNPLTSRMRLQFLFFKKYILEPNVNTYFVERNLKYNNREIILPLFTAAPRGSGAPVALWTPGAFESLPPYFSDWLGGFIEAEGSFSARVKGNYTFDISQNHDKYLIESIREFYNVAHLSIGKTHNKVSGYPFYSLSVGSAIGAGRVIDHCKSLLQGYKYYQLAVFVINSKVFQNRLKDFFFE